MVGEAKDYRITNYIYYASDFVLISKFRVLKVISKLLVTLVLLMFIIYKPQRGP